MLDDADALSLSIHERNASKAAIHARIALTLTSEEKLAGRRALQHVVYAEPAPSRFWEWLPIPGKLPSMAFSVLLLLGVSGVGLTYAAEDALPGDTLYGVKIYVNEAVRSSLQFTAADRARWAVERLRRRMEELHQLSARGVANGDLDVALGDHVESAAHDVEIEVEALPAAAAERAAMRTAVNAAIGDDQDALRRASRINRVLKALKQRAEGFDQPVGEPTVAPVPSGNEQKLVPVPSANARARGANEVDVRVETPPVDVETETRVDADAAASADADDDRDAAPAADDDLPAVVPDAVEAPTTTVDHAVDGLLP